MTNIYDKANEFEKVLRASEEYKAVEQATNAVYDDEDSKKLYSEFIATQKKFMQSFDAGVEPAQEDMKKFEALQKDLMANEKIVALVQAQQKLQFIVEDLNRVMFKPLEDLFTKFEG